MATTRKAFLKGLGGLASMAVLQPVALASTGRSALWPGGRRGAVSLTYDDGLDSQLENAVPALDRRGLKGIFFLTRENMEDRVGDWQAVSRHGHEIADHTFHHPCALQPYSGERFETEEIAPLKTSWIRTSAQSGGSSPILAAP